MTLHSTDFEYIRQLVHDHSALVLASDKSYLVESRLTPLIRQVGVPSIHNLILQLRNQPFSSLHQQVLEAMVTTETLFFRDHHPFEVLRTSIVPKLIQQRDSQRTLNLWCAACSSGQEPYSLAILLREYFPQLVSWTVTLMASDLSGKILDRATIGRYHQHEVERGVPQPLLQKYFQQQGKQWQIREEIRQMVVFQQFNLAGAWPSLPRMDIVFMRNVLIYFDVATKQAVLNQVKQILRLDGYLFLGSGETTLNLDNTFEPVQSHQAVFYRLLNGTAREDQKETDKDNR